MGRALLLDEPDGGALLLLVVETSSGTPGPSDVRDVELGGFEVEGLDGLSDGGGEDVLSLSVLRIPLFVDDDDGERGGVVMVTETVAMVEEVDGGGGESELELGGGGSELELEGGGGTSVTLPESLG